MQVGMLPGPASNPVPQLRSPLSQPHWNRRFAPSLVLFLPVSQPDRVGTRRCLKAGVAPVHGAPENDSGGGGDAHIDPIHGGRRPVHVVQVLGAAFWISPFRASPQGRICFSS